MSAPRALPDGPLVAFYGDDFTGSSAAMEALAFAGLETVLFLAPPTPERLAAFAGFRGIGIAGVARSRDPAWMDRHLPPVFRLLKSLGAPVVHYKVCSTFDSAPQIGSIGRAVDLAAELFDGWMPLVVGEPSMGRFQCFGHLFALAQGRGYRLDRHPTMAQHPVTPMDEADLGRHLARQTTKPIGLVDFVAMKRGRAMRGSRRRSPRAAASCRSTCSTTKPWSRPGGSSGNAAARRSSRSARRGWRSRSSPIGGPLACSTPSAPGRALGAPSASPACRARSRPSPRARSPTRPATASPASASSREEAVDERAWQAEIERATGEALRALGAGRDPLVYSAAGPGDPAVAALREAVAASGASSEVINDRIGSGLGRVLDALVRKARLPRVVISGGDTSGHAAAMLGIDALTAIAPVAPGSPLCRAHALDPARDGLQMALKGGQVGGDDFFCAVREGRAA